MNEATRIIEVNGVKLEVDLRNAKRVDNYRVGDPVKVLVKNYSGFTVRYGVIVDFAEFEQRPAIEVLTVDPAAYSNDPITFVTITKDTEDYELAPMGVVDHVFSRDNVLQKFDREIEETELKLLQAKTKRELFCKHFGKFFEQTEGALS